MRQTNNKRTGNIGKHFKQKQWGVQGNSKTQEERITKQQPKSNQIQKKGQQRQQKKKTHTKITQNIVSLLGESCGCHTDQVIKQKGKHTYSKEAME